MSARGEYSALPTDIAAADDDVGDGFSVTPAATSSTELRLKCYLSFSLAALTACLILLTALLTTHPTLWSASTSPSPLSPLPPPHPLPSYPAHSAFLVPPGRTLVLYVHSENDEGHRPNLLFFIDRAIRCWHDADYRILLQHVTPLPPRKRANPFVRKGPSAPVPSELPPLPPNALYVQHENECLDWGTASWALALPHNHSAHVDPTAYRYFIILNSSVRGPLLPSWLDSASDLDHSAQCSGEVRPGLLPWYHLFLARLDGPRQTKLVGCTINCENRPHVQGYMAAMDFVALQLLWQVDGLSEEAVTVRLEEDYERWQRSAGLTGLAHAEQGALACPANYSTAVWRNEIGASSAVLKAGYNIAALQHFWADTDFRAQEDVCAPLMYDWQNPTFAGSPMRARSSDRQALRPTEVVFLKKKAWPRQKYEHEKELEFWLEWDNRSRRTREAGPRPLTTPLFTRTGAGG